MTREEFDSGKINNWEELTEFYDTLYRRFQQDTGVKWVFRGQKASGGAHTLETSLERAFRSFGIEGDVRRRRERDLIREFQRKLHLYASNLPSRHDISEWLNLMQHHGAPTRLLDWSYSFWVAVYFAVNQLDCSEQGREKAEIWALNLKWFDRTSRERVRREKSDEILARAMKRGVYVQYADPLAQANTALVWHLMHRPRLLVLAMNSFRLNHRITTQQGVFLLPGDIRRPFMENLEGVPDSSDHIHVRTLDFDVATKNRVLINLLKMNVNSSVLFPGLDGFTQSLRTRLALSSRETRSVGIP